MPHPYTLALRALAELDREGVRQAVRELHAEMVGAAMTSENTRFGQDLCILRSLDIPAASEIADRLERLARNGSDNAEPAPQGVAYAGLPDKGLTPELTAALQRGADGVFDLLKDWHLINKDAKAGRRLWQIGRNLEGIFGCALRGDYTRSSHGQAPAGAAQKYDDTLRPFLALMRRELHANSAKGDRPGWLKMSADTALLEIYWHTAKLSAAVKNNDGPAIIEHSADVANMAMMLLDVCGGIPTAQAAPASVAGVMQFGGCPECGSVKCVARACVLPPGLAAVPTPLGYAMAYRTGKPIFATSCPNLWDTLEGARQASSLNLGAGEPIPVYAATINPTPAG